jgi:signal transduction histidine kinase
MIEPVEQQMVVPRWQRLLLPSAMLEEPRGRRSVRDWIVDLTMFALALGIGALVLQDTWSDHSDLQAVVDIVLGVIAAMSLWWRRSHPAAVGAFAGTLSLVSALGNGAGVMAFFNAALRTSGRTLAALIGLALVNTIVFPLIYPGADAYVAQLLVGLLITGVVVGWGLFVRVQRELVRSLRERAERLQAEQRLKVDQAREAERLRIAREMHDVLAHRVSLLSLHAGALEFRPDASPEEIAEAAGVIRATAHAALEDLRGVVGVLRDGAEDGAPEPPQPTLDQIPGLIEESRAAGMRVRAQIEAPAEALPAAVGRTAYRVVQEGLTNARKHAPGAAVDVAVSAREGDGLVVEVVSRRPVGVAVAAGGDRMPGAGTGLIGLAERVALAGGELHHGPDAAGDFVLRATIPWAA